MSRQMMGTPIQRFSAKFVANGYNDCWIWTGAVESQGYGRFCLHGKTIYAHRASFILHNSVIPDGMQIDHLCRNRRCVNPSHLEIVTQKENILRGESPTAKHARQAVCIRGHELSGKNLRIAPNGARKCKTCHNSESKRSYMKKKSVLLALLLFILFVGATEAQTTYTLNKPFVCLASGHYTPTDFSYFDCRGVQYLDANGKLGAETYVPYLIVYTPNWTISSYNSSLTVTGFTRPANGNPGTFAYTWSGTDGTGAMHNGTATGTWTEIVDWRGWHHPVIQTSSLTVNQ